MRESDPVNSVFTPIRWRIVILGLPGSGKTTLAKRLVKYSSLHHIELDEGRWGAGWKMSSPEAEVEFVQMQIAAHPNGWVFCGDNALATRIAMANANVVLWLDIPPWKTGLRFFRRTWKRILTREELWNGNYERLWVALFKHPLEIMRNLYRAVDVNNSYRQELMAMVAMSPVQVYIFLTDEEVDTWIMPSLFLCTEWRGRGFSKGWIVYKDAIVGASQSRRKRYEIFFNGRM